MVTSKNIRLATVQDAQSILSVYRPYVLETPISFEIEPPSLGEIQNRISQTLENFPWLVFQEGDAVLGYAYAGPFKSRCAYSWSVESSVYIKQGFHRKGIGRLLYQNLIERLKYQGAVNIIGGISLPNEASVRLHESLGFTPVAKFKDIGFKLGQWWDVGYWQLQIQKPTEPKPLQKPLDG